MAAGSERRVLPCAGKPPAVDPNRSERSSAAPEPVEGRRRGTGEAEPVQSRDSRAPCRFVSRSTIRCRSAGSSEAGRAGGSLANGGSSGSSPNTGSNPVCAFRCHKVRPIWLGRAGHLMTGVPGMSVACRPRCIPWRSVPNRQAPDRRQVTEDELRESAAAWAERTAIEQGLPPRVMDIAVLRKVLRLLGLVEPEQSEVE
jgi:hypothetical protein